MVHLLEVRTEHSGGKIQNIVFLFLLPSYRTTTNNSIIHKHHLIIALCFWQFDLGNWEYLDLFPRVTKDRQMREVSNYKPNMNIFGRGLARYQASPSSLCSIKVTYQLHQGKTIRIWIHTSKSLVSSLSSLWFKLDSS